MGLEGMGQQRSRRHNAAHCRQRPPHQPDSREPASPSSARPPIPFGRPAVQRAIVVWIAAGWLVVGAAWWRLPSLTEPLNGDRQRRMTIDLNQAPAEELALLPGVGMVLAERIVADRARHGDFASVDAVTRVAGIGPAKLQQLRSWCTVTNHSGSSTFGIAANSPRITASER